MELKEIQYIRSIARFGSITKAASSLYITQPALSKFLKNLEQQVGAPLFSRIGGELVPTHVGERYLSYVDQIDSLRSDWRAECADLLGEARGRLSVAIPLTRSGVLLPAVLTQFYATYPQIEVVLHEESFFVERHLLETNDTDLVLYNDTIAQSSLIHEPLGEEEIVLIAPHTHPLVQHAKPRTGCAYPWLDLALCAEYPFILHPPEQTTGRITAQLLALYGVAPKVLLQTRSADVAIQLALSCGALTFAPASYVSRHHTAPLPCYFSVGAPKTTTTLYAIYRKGRYLPAYAQHFLSLVRSAMRDN